MSKDEMSLNILRKVVVDGLMLGMLIVCLIVMNAYWVPFQRGFFCGDESFMFPFKNDTVEVWLLRTVGIGLPLIAFLICEWTLLRNDRNDQRCFGIRIPAWIRGFYCVCISFGIGLCFSEFASEIAKNTIGRPRPFFFAICQPSVNCSSSEWKNRYIQPHEYSCTGNRVDQFHNMRKSFLSGHASWAAYTMIYLALYLQARMVWKGTRVLRHVLQFGCLMLSWFTALSRVSDYRHHWSDVLAGYTLGFVVAAVMWIWGTDLVKKKKGHKAVPQFELYLQARMVWKGTRVLRHVLQFGCLMLSWFTALSRVSDYRHHWSDVLAGYTLGFVVAAVMWIWGTDLVKKKKGHKAVPQFEVNLNCQQIPIA